MKYIEPSFEEIKIDDFYGKIEKVARNCYQSIGKENGSKEFVQRLINAKHLAMIEHYIFVVEVPTYYYSKLLMENIKFINFTNFAGRCLISFSARVLLENENELLVPLKALIGNNVDDLFKKNPYDFKGFKLLDSKDVDNLSISEQLVHRYISLKIITDRGVSHELVRHRIASYAQESTRYCNYSKDKFSSELTFITPFDYNESTKAIYDETYKLIEQNYFKLLNANSRPELARAILPNGLKTSIIITCNLQELNKIFELRLDKAAHPDMRKIMQMIYDYIGVNYHGTIKI